MLVVWRKDSGIIELISIYRGTAHTLEQLFRGRDISNLASEIIPDDTTISPLFHRVVTDIEGKFRKFTLVDYPEGHNPKTYYLQDSPEIIEDFMNRDFDDEIVRRVLDTITDKSRLILYQIEDLERGGRFAEYFRSRGL